MSTSSIGQSQFALRLFFSYGAVVSIAIGIGYALTQILGGPVTVGLSLPPAFVWSSVLLVAGSMFLHRALNQVRVEKQKPFRRALLLGLLCGTLFVGLQSYGLWYLLHTASPDSDAQTSAHGFVFVFAVLHALHFSVALMFLVFVTLKSFLDRYDHEYYWGVTVCAWFWHVLGIAWMAILMVFVIATRGS